MTNLHVLRQPVDSTAYDFTINLLVIFLTALVLLAGGSLLKSFRRLGHA